MNTDQRAGLTPPTGSSEGSKGISRCQISQDAKESGPPDSGDTGGNGPCAVLVPFAGLSNGHHHHLHHGGQSPPALQLHLTKTNNVSSLSSSSSSSSSASSWDSDKENSGSNSKQTNDGGGDVISSCYNHGGGRHLVGFDEVEESCDALSSTTAASEPLCNIRQLLQPKLKLDLKKNYEYKPKRYEELCCLVPVAIVT